VLAQINHLAPEFEYDPLYLDRVYQGVEGVRQMWADTIETWADYRFAMEEIGRGVGGGVPIDQPLAILGRFRGEKLVWAKSFRSKQEALEAVGLPVRREPG